MASYRCGVQAMDKVEGAQNPLRGRCRGPSETTSGLGGGGGLWTPWGRQGGATEDSKLSGEGIKLAFSESKL